MAGVKRERIAVILFNLGGPDSLAAVYPFLLNLFSDPDILRMPGFLRWILARVIARRRLEEAKKIYAQLGGGSPILPETRRQQEALEKEMQDRGFENLRCFTVMRYSAPRAQEVILELQRFSPERIVLLPLYPQYSTTTTRSSLKEWRDLSSSSGLTADTHIVGCYFEQADFIASHVAVIRAAAPQYYGDHGNHKALLLFSAHGLPQRIADSGDPYPDQIRKTAVSIVTRLGLGADDWEISYQSRVGPLKWLQPATEARLRAAGAAGRPVVLVPISFISEHSETLVELDIELKHLAEMAGVPEYIRAPALGVQSDFIRGLASLAGDALDLRDKAVLCGAPEAAKCCLSGERYFKDGLSD
ncbi:MAG TPA: ferrochelatase [Alphaproteobacteria bacterium]|jgi:protoporphyrin/coproporphyrin ferrochelatase|nr:ferrochelatase [Alphaproteobacteria bacterium]